MKKHFISVQNIKTGKRRNAVTPVRDIGRLHAFLAARGWIINRHYEK